MSSQSDDLTMDENNLQIRKRKYFTKNVFFSFFSSLKFDTNQKRRGRTIDWQDLYFPIGCGMAKGGVPPNVQLAKQADGSYTPVTIETNVHENIIRKFINFSSFRLQRMTIEVMLIIIINQFEITNLIMSIMHQILDHMKMFNTIHQQILNNIIQIRMNFIKEFIQMKMERICT